MQAGEPRVELDMPTLIVTEYGHVEMDGKNGKNLEALISSFFNVGDVITLHIVAEWSGLTRQFCTFEIHQGTYKHACGETMNANGICFRESEHQQQREAEAAEQVATE